MHSYLLELLILLSSAVIVVPFFRFFKLGAILAYLFAGVIIGPEVLALVKDPKTILSFSELGVVFLLFLIGLELQPKVLWRMRAKVFGLGLMQMGLTGSALMGLGWLWGWSWELSFVAGFGLALSSTAFGLQLLEENRQLKTQHGQGSFAILLFQDLAVVPLIAAVPILAGGVGKTATWLDVLRFVGVVSSFILVGLYFIHHFFRFIAQSRAQEVFTALSLLLVIGSALLMEEVGLSMGTGAFLAGVLLANSEYRHEIDTDLQPFKGLLLGLFFIAVGMSLDLEVLLSQPHVVLLIVASFMLIKGIIIYFLARSFRYPFESSRNMAFTLPQGGEFAFVLFSVAMGAHLLTSEMGAVLNAAVTLSMALTPLLFYLNQKYLRTYSEVSEKPYDDITSEGAEVIIAGYGRFGQIVSRALQTQGISFTILEHDATQVDTARRYGVKIFYGDASRKEIVQAAGGSDAKIFVLAIDDPAASVKTAKMVKKHFPNLEIIARVRNRQHAIDLLADGIERVHREIYLTSLDVARQVMIDLGRNPEQVDRRLQIFKNHDEDVLRKQLEFRDDEKSLISFTKKSNAELEAILRADEEL